ncbi:MAG: DegT/DnrJ/EryC1/StrS aminotransferase family protein [Nitrospirae bacterium]|nr:DegT/DnrJ/EryC1/StrS aminotransferase family protein [Nitrospirota bacterium]
MTATSGRSKFLPALLPFIEEDDIRAVNEVLRSGWLTVGKRCLDFESALAKFMGARHVHAVSSCTAALHLALTALGLKKGDVVVTSPITFTATVAAIVHTGATPLLADVDRDTGNLDPAQVEKLARTNRRIRAIIPVHFAGHPCEMDALLSLARKHRWLVVEDAAHALAAEYKGTPIGALPSTATCFSFYACKNLCAIEGGAIATDSATLDRRVRLWSLHGISRDAWKRYGEGGSWRYDVVEPGFKNNFTDVQAALALSQLGKLDRLQRRREKIALRYGEVFQPLEALEVPVVRSDVKMAWHIYVLRLRKRRLKIGRDGFIEELRRRNIGTSVHFVPIHLHSAYKKILKKSAKDYPVAMDFYSRALTLPLHPGMTDEDVQDVIESVLDICRRNRA